MSKKNYAEFSPILRKKELLKIFQISKSTLYFWIKQGLIPKPKKIGRLSFWFKKDIDATLKKIEGGNSTDA